MIKYGILLTLSLFHHAPTTIAAFSVSPKARLHSYQKPLRKHKQTRTLRSFTSIQHLSTSLKLSDPDDEIQVISYDGSIADTSEWRSKLAVEAALETWPHLKDYSNVPTGASVDGVLEVDQSWLINKMCALSHVMISDHDGMMGYDAVLLARLLLEEQLLDLGRSDGCKGKYGSKFHPSASVANKGTEKFSNGSRPLTVGEIASNWSNGACLRETLRAKYNVQRKDPLPIIKENLSKKIDTEFSSLPKVHPFMKEALSLRENNIFILVGDTMHIPTALASLSKSSISVQVTASIDDALEKSMHLKRKIFIVPPGDGEQGHRGILQHLLLQAKCGTSVHLIHSSLEHLLEAKLLFGDNRPSSQYDGYGKSAFGSGVSLKLSLPTWADNTKLSQENSAEMDPWMNLVSENEVTEEFSAKIFRNR